MQWAPVICVKGSNCEHTLSWRVILVWSEACNHKSWKFARSLRVKNQTNVPMTTIPSASAMRVQFRITRPIVTWFGWTMAPMDRANVTKRTIPSMVPAEADGDKHRNSGES